MVLILPRPAVGVPRKYISLYKAYEKQQSGHANVRNWSGAKNPIPYTDDATLFPPDVPV